MGREDNVFIFRDTERLCKSNTILVEAINYSVQNQKLILESESMPKCDKKKYENKAEIIISGKRSYEAAGKYKGQRVCVHNFASASNPGGGVTKGASAQEECLCRCSSLYFCLNTQKMWDGFYGNHRKSLWHPCGI